ncbi:Ppx/GppA phosphatase family protein [Rhodococcus aerolatus]
MRLGVLDVGSNTVHLLVVDAHRGGHPTPMSSTKSTLRLAEQLDGRGRLTRTGADRLLRAVHEAADVADDAGCREVLAFATSAVRDATNSAEVLDRVQRQTGVALRVLSGEDESRLTFLAVRRWYGWSAGPILAMDIGGGSLELATGLDEAPDVALSLPLGAGRLSREWLGGDVDTPPDPAAVARLRDHLDTTLAPAADRLRREHDGGRVVATSKTFRSLARLTGAAPSAAGPRVRRVLTAAGLRQLVAFISRMSTTDLSELEGVSAARSHQLVAGALVAEASMRALAVEELEICPWALREGVILRRLDAEPDDAGTDVRAAGGAA